MDARLMLIAASALSLATMAAAEPAKSPEPVAPSGAKERPVVLAAAEIPATAAVAGAEGAVAATPAVPARKPRTARVTTCRCADTPNQ